jgi:proteic killer suppression protein
MLAMPGEKFHRVDSSRNGEHDPGLSRDARSGAEAGIKCNLLRYSPVDACNALCYSSAVIKSFNSKALRRFWTKNDRSAVSASFRNKIQLLLVALDKAKRPGDMTFPGSGFHALTGDMAGRYALTVSRNWRITFAFHDGDATDVDLEDYHGDD